MIIAKGYRVVLRKVGGGVIRPVASYALLHDPEGGVWPKCSGLIAPFTRRRREIKNKTAFDYFNYDPRGGSLILPPRSLREWSDLGEVDGIDYTRPGDKEIAGQNNTRYTHDFDRGMVFKKDFPHVFKRGTLYRIELGVCTWNWRGIVTP